jgi:hypothetical protein
MIGLVVLEIKRLTKPNRRILKRNISKKRKNSKIDNQKMTNTIIIDQIETLKAKTMRIISNKMTRTHIRVKKTTIAITTKKTKIN